jgi:hypothetical protein
MENRGKQRVWNRRENRISQELNEFNEVPDYNDPAENILAYALRNGSRPAELLEPSMLVSHYATEQSIGFPYNCGIAGKCQ